MELILIGLLGVIFVLVTMYLLRGEGFAVLSSSGTRSLPAPAQESSISHDLPGAVTPAPDDSSASTEDLIALQDAINFFKDSVKAKQEVDEQTMNQKRMQGSVETLGSLKELKSRMNQDSDRVKGALTDLSKNDFTVEESQRLRSFYEMGADQLLTLAEGFANPPGSYKIAGPYLTTNDLQELINRIQAERTKLVNLRTMDAPVRERINQLEKLGADIRALREKVVRKQMDPRDLPIETEAARQFLKTLSGSTIPPLITPSGANPSTVASPASVIKGDDPVVQKLLDQAKNLRWSMQVTVGYDPIVVQREKLLQRLDSVEKRLQELSVKKETEDSRKEYERLHKELTSLTTSIGQSFQGPSTPPAYVRPQSSTVTRLPDMSNQLPGPSGNNLDNIQCGDFSDPYTSIPSSVERPAGMTDEQIKHRASSGNPSLEGVGGPDYKVRVQDLCRSITASGLGDAKDFGCLANPDTVGPTYSWKGAHKMICNRVGDTWGASYPEQFGCGKYDPTARFDAQML